MLQPNGANLKGGWRNSGILGLLAGLGGSLLGGVTGLLAGAIVAPTEDLPLLTMILGAVAGGWFASRLLMSKGRVGNVLGSVCGGGLVVLAVFLPSFLGPGDAGKRSGVKSNMHTIQSGLEQYAAEHRGKYPISLQPRDFSWARYVPAPPHNPYDYEMTGSKLVDSSVTDARPAQRAAGDKRSFQAAGMIRYYVSPTQAQYALTGAERDGRPIMSGEGDTVFTLAN